MRKNETTKQENIIITYEDYILDDWLCEMINELVTYQPTLLNDLNVTEE